jgi:hypothetical protein
MNGAFSCTGEMGEELERFLSVTIDFMCGELIKFKEIVPTYRERHMLHRSSTILKDSGVTGKRLLKS